MPWLGDNYFIILNTIKMKRLIHIFPFIIALLAFTGCFQDKSTFDTEKIDEIRIETVSVNYFDENLQAIFIPTQEVLNLKVNVIKGNNSNPNVTYKWKINPSPWLIPSLDLEGEDELNYKVGLKISTTDPYRLSVTVTDEDTGLKYFKEWKLYVSGKFSEGIVIAHTKDNATSDLSFVSSQMFSENSVSEFIDQNIFSSGQGAAMQGLVTHMVYYASQRSIFGVTGTKESFRVNANDFSLYGYGKELFTYDAISTSNATGMYFGNTGNIYMIDNGLIYAAYSSNSHKFPSAIHYNSNPPYNVDGPLVCYTHNPGDKARGIFYDASSSTIKVLKATQSPLYTRVYDLKTGVTNKTAVGAGVNSNERLVLILKDKSTNIHTIYTAYNGTETPVPGDIDEVTSMDIPSTNDILNAKGFFICDNQPVIYYYTSTAIYAINTQTGVPVISQKYVVNAGEEITTMQVFQQAWYQQARKKTGAVPIASHNKTLLISTYNNSSKIGKLVAIPIINLGEGNLDKANQREFAGFDKITAVASVGL